MRGTPTRSHLQNLSSLIPQIDLLFEDSFFLHLSDHSKFHSDSSTITIIFVENIGLSSKCC